ncbi:MAG: class I SAM-dependent methyltransferase [Bacteroidota bacterium]
MLRAWHIQKEARTWSKKAPENAFILDAGSGFGQYDYFLSSLNSKWRILAIDVKEEQVADCNSFFKEIGRPQVKFQVGDLTKYKAPDTYDLVLCVDVMEHILEDRKAFENYCSSLKKGGMLLISTPSDQGGSGIEEHADGEVQGFIDEHVRDGYPIEEIEEKILTAGFEIVEAKYSYGTPGKISWKLSMYLPMRVLGVSKLFLILLPFYYILTFPFCIALNYLDVHSNHRTGTGLIVKAWK